MPRMKGACQVHAECTPGACRYFGCMPRMQSRPEGACRECKVGLRVHAANARCMPAHGMHLAFKAACTRKFWTHFLFGVMEEAPVVKSRRMSHWESYTSGNVWYNYCSRKENSAKNVRNGAECLIQKRIRLVMYGTSTAARRKTRQKPGEIV
jgi:hypothetical protein